MTDFVARPDVHARFLAVKARADQRVADEWAALKAGVKSEQWNPSGLSPEKMRERNRRNAVVLRSRRARKAETR